MTHNPLPGQRTLEGFDESAFDHFVRLAQRGKYPGASGGERRAYNAAFSIAENTAGIDDKAIHGMKLFVDFAQQHPHEAQDLISN